ncbi:potassium channel subfamily K member 9 isoform X1 [Hydra vulgaris]|uniref:Potassium channel subfamily K member 9 isoform X1 n=1 Tax=Hydra vulgaris TaxID=6087 RepID=A0ABM4D3K6_HYDVU
MVIVMWFAQKFARKGYPKSRHQYSATIKKLELDRGPFQPSIKILIIRGIVIISYLLLGALVFQALEKNDNQTRYWNDLVIASKDNLVKNHNISLKTLEVLEHQIQQMIVEKRNSQREWDYYQSLYFASTVTTTIGYGHITPQTQEGRVFLILFALIGIPLNILALASVGEHITVSIYTFLRYCNNRFTKKHKLKNINIKVMLVSIALMVCMLFLGGFLYWSTESWTYIDSIYYCFIAMSTIGFGDLVPNRGKAPDSKEEKAIWFLRALYLSVGLSLVSTVFTALSNAMEEINSILSSSKFANSLNLNMLCCHHQDTTYFRSSFQRRLRQETKKFEKISRSTNTDDESVNWDELLEKRTRKESFTKPISQRKILSNGFHDSRILNQNTEVSSIPKRNDILINYKSESLKIPQLSLNRKQPNYRHKTLFPNQSNPFDNVRSKNSLKNYSSSPIFKYSSHGILIPSQDIKARSMESRSNCGMNFFSLNSSPEEYDIMINQC